jgi:hypothetical protein
MFINHMEDHPTTISSDIILLYVRAITLEAIWICDHIRVHSSKILLQQLKKKLRGL